MMMESLEQRQLLAGDVLPPIPVIDAFTGARNIGSVQSTPFTESELNGVQGGNDNIFSADLVPLGTGPGQSDTIDLTGSVDFQIRTPAVTQADGTITPATFNTDLDFFAFDLRAGDILDIATLGSVSNFTVLNSDGSIWFGADDNQSFGYPSDSPLQTLGNTAFAQVVPEDGRYFIAFAPDTVAGQYTVGLRVYRPIIESLPIGSQQFVFLDLDGAILPASVLDDGSGVPQTGIVRFPSLRESLPQIGLEPLDDAAFDRFIDLMLEALEEDFAFLAANGNAGDFDQTGTPGDFGITFLNSRDHADPGAHPLVTRVFVGDDGGTFNLAGAALGISTTLDIGNFSLDDVVFSFIDDLDDVATSVPISNTVSVLEVIADFAGFLTSHEIAHSFGQRHTDSTNTVNSIIDEGGNIPGALGVGLDGIFGTLDDMPAQFFDDTFSLNEGLLGTNRVTNTLANTLVTGTVGGSVTGRVFNDTNRDGSGTNDAGLAGVTVFADINGNGVADPSEPATVTGADGTFVLSSSGGSANVIAVAPEQFAASTPTSVPATFVLGGSVGGIEFGFTQVIADITGTKFADLDGDGFFDSNEPGLGDVFIYLDLDGDNRPDLGEPAALTGPDGSYSLNFPGPGTFTIREVVAPGFVQTFPGPALGGEHTVVFDGTALTDNFNFGNLPSRDFGDAPDQYGTLEASNGPSHGLTEGLSIGNIAPDRELNGQPSIDALGDDGSGVIGLNGQSIDDEDGVVLLEPLGPGASADLAVTLQNETGSPAFLQGWIDFNIDGDFNDPGEQIANNLEVGTGTFTLPVAVPSNATIGTTYARFRYSQTSGLGPNGLADTGEVEDYAFPILAAAQIANDDPNEVVSRNSQANEIFVLDNDFETADNQLQIINRNITGTVGEVVIAGDARSIFYTPRNGFIGIDQFSYTVQDEFGRQSTATVTVNVTFQTSSPIALDDTFDVAQGSTNRALNVLDNDVPSIAGGSSITSVTPGTNGGSIAITGGGQSLRYTPLPGFNGTEQFTYSIQDTVGATSSATVTINLLPGSQADDDVEFSIEILDSINQQPISNVQVGDTFDVRVSVDDLRTGAINEGVASAFLDLLYTDELVAVLNTGANSAFQFDISFGELFTGIDANELENNTVQGGSAGVPGLINEVGGVQTSIPSTSHTGPVELFTVRLQAVSPGVAVFQADPADSDFGETVLVSIAEALEVERLRFDRQELVIFPSSDNFASAIDDSFPQGRDSNGDLISRSIGGQAVAARLNVLDNDNLGPTGQITELGLVAAPGIGNAQFNDNGTPDNLNDDFIEYFADVGANGFDQFTYLIVTADGVRSIGNVSLTVGNADADDIASIEFNLVDEFGNDINSVSVGERFGVQVIVEDERVNPEFVFSAFLDLIYSDNIAPTNIVLGGNLDFDATFGDLFDPATAVGTSIRPGLIDEFGVVLGSIVSNNGVGANPNPDLMATIFFEALAGGQASVVGGPADNLDFQETTLFGLNDPVPVSQIRYDVLEIEITGQGETVQQNTANPFDVNANGTVDALDVILGINAFSTRQSNIVAQGEFAGSALFLDVDGNSRFTPVDIILVLNHLVDVVAAQGEQIISDTLETPVDDDSSVEVADTIFASIEDNNLTTGSSVGSSQIAAPIEIIGLEQSDDDDDDDEADVLSLLADDLSGLGT